jgi:hypothetical protein
MPLAYGLRIGASDSRSAQGVQVGEPDSGAGSTCGGRDVLQTDPCIAQLAIVESKNLAPPRGPPTLVAEMSDRTNDKVCDALAPAAMRPALKVCLRQHALLQFAI